MENVINYASFITEFINYLIIACQKITSNASALLKFAQVDLQNLSLHCTRQISVRTLEFSVPSTISATAVSSFIIYSCEGDKSGSLPSGSGSRFTSSQSSQTPDSS